MTDLVVIFAGMDGINLLKAEAREKRDKALGKARHEYMMAIREIRAVERKLRSAEARRRSRQLQHFHVLQDKSLKEATAIQAAEVVLGEGKPLTLIELTIEVMNRGCRATDDPKVVANAIRGSLSYHKGRFWRDAEGGEICYRHHIDCAKALGVTDQKLILTEIYGFNKMQPRLYFIESSCQIDFESKRLHFILDFGRSWADTCDTHPPGCGRSYEAVPLERLQP